MDVRMEEELCHQMKKTMLEYFRSGEFLFDSPTYLTLLCMRGGGGNLRPHPLVGFFLITFVSLKLRAWKFFTLSFYYLDTMWWNFINKYWLVDNYDPFVINDWKFFAKKKSFSYKHMSMFFISCFFIHSLL